MVTVVNGVAFTLSQVTQIQIDLALLFSPDDWGRFHGMPQMAETGSHGAQGFIA